MKKTPHVTNHIKELCAHKGLSSLQLANKIGTSAPHMSRLINGQSPLLPKWLLKISKVLKVPTSKIGGVPAHKKFAHEEDDTLHGSIVGWIDEASTSYKVKLSRPQTLKLTRFMYKEALHHPLHYAAARAMTITMVRAKKLWV